MQIKEDANKVVNVLLDTAYAGQVFTFGNGGSASIANHMECDWMKLTHGLVTVRSLAANGSVLSAIANDIDYASTASKQLEWLASKYDIVVLISSSGTSRNIVKAAKTAKMKGCPVIGFSGNAKETDGGGLRRLADVSVHCNSTDYGEIEDYHSMVMHEVARQLTKRVT